MFHKRTLEKLTVKMLNLFLGRHHLAHGKMKKREKVLTIQRWLANSEVHRIQPEVSPDSNEESSDADSDSYESDQISDDDDVVLMEVGETSDDDESDSEEQGPRSSINTINSRSGRSCTTYLTRHFFGDSD